MAQTDKTRSGLEPNRNKILYKINTKDVEEHLQNAINMLVKDLRDNKGKNVKDVKITVLTNPIAKFYRPFIIALPIDSAAKGQGGNKSENLSIYENEDNNKNIQLHDWLYNLLRSLTYDKSDVRAFDSTTFRREVGLTPAAANTMKQYSRPRVHSTREDRKPTHIVLYLDPLRVFTNMLTKPGDGKFKVIIKKDEIKDLNVGETEFEVIKVYETRGPRSDERQKLQKLITKNINNKR